MPNNASSNPNLTRLIAMPNEIFSDMSTWLSQKELKSPHHQEFVYSYYWYISYLWRYAVYAEAKVIQQDIKKNLGYNPSDDRLNYIIKKNGLLDIKQYTSSTKDYPISWKFENKQDGVSFTMYSELSNDYQKLVSQFGSDNYLIKAPLLSLGTEESDGLYWNTSDSHFMSINVFNICMENVNLQCAGFYMCGLLKYLEGKSLHFNKRSNFECSNETLAKLTGWGRDKIRGVTNNLMDADLLEKEQQTKMKGQRNAYKLSF
jgi:hypothetical protein